MKTHKKVYAPSIVLVEKYLKKHGWRLWQTTNRDIIWSKPYINYNVMPKVYLPASEQFGDYDRGMEEVFDILATVEQRDSYDIWLDVVRHECEDD